MTGENEDRSQSDQIQEALETVEDPRLEGGEEELEEVEDSKTEGSEISEEEETPEEPVKDIEDKEKDDPYEKLQRELKETRDELKQIRDSQTEEDVDELEDKDPPEPVNFITREEAEAIIEDPDKLVETFNEKLNLALNMAREFALTEVPDAVTTRVNQATTIRDKSRDFYQKHPQLVKHKSYVGFLANKLSENYNNLDDLFEATAERAYEELGVDKKARNREADRKKKPAFAKKPSSSTRTKQPKEATDEQQKQINTMVDALGPS